MSSCVLVSRNVVEDLATSIIRVVEYRRKVESDGLVDKILSRIEFENKTFMGRLFKLQVPTRQQILNAKVSDPWVNSLDLQSLAFIKQMSDEEYELAVKVMEALPITVNNFQLSLEDAQLLAWGLECKKWLVLNPCE